MCRVVLDQNTIVSHIEGAPVQQENYIRQIEVQILKVLLDQNISTDDSQQHMQLLWSQHS